MPHIAVSMLPGRNREVKQELAERLRDTLMETLGVDEKFVSVSVEDVELEDWDDSMKRFPEEHILINPNKK
ncbi:tautomerase family protein [uncultured Odoribacter sp.]|uniref:tautomerase family protein n=1 Tax=uncultured Odoribacter sp. TaxID=876416 RepID=UPI002609F5CF|nr:tautomerase family protein [uncultured Odoribacter sp.]